MRLVDQMTGCASDFPLAIFGLWSRLLEYLESNNRFRGRRLRDISLRAFSYEEHGVFCKNMDGGTFTLKVRNTNATCHLHAYDNISEDEFDALSLENNWSETRCLLIDKKGVRAPVRLCEVLSNITYFVDPEFLQQWKDMQNRYQVKLVKALKNVVVPPAPGAEDPPPASADAGAGTGDAPAEGNSTPAVEEEGEAVDETEETFTLDEDAAA